MLEDQRTRKRKNYVVRLARDSELLGNSGNMGTNYDMDSIQPDPANSEELSAFIVDYANMIRNDVVLLDKSVETRTRKRGKVGKHHNVSIRKRVCETGLSQFAVFLYAVYLQFVNLMNITRYATVIKTVERAVRL